VFVGAVEKVTAIGVEAFRRRLRGLPPDLKVWVCGGCLAEWRWCGLVPCVQSWGALG
jgi:hypothetical protein